jgi:prophage DNA circulation protein
LGVESVKKVRSLKKHGRLMTVNGKLRHTVRETGSGVVAHLEYGYMPVIIAACFIS